MSNDNGPTPKQKVLATAAELKLTMTAVFVPWSQSRNKDRKDMSLNWRVTIHRDGREVLTTDYSAGIAHCPTYRVNDRPVLTVVQYQKIRLECETGKRAGRWMDGFNCVQPTNERILPDLDDVLYSLVLDSSVIDHGTFESWAEDFGYDLDSRKAEAIYRACLAIALQFRAAIGNDGMKALQTACEEY